MVKKIFLICICSGLICFLCVACQDRDVAKSFPEDISGTAVSGNYPIVIDETGKERELKLGEVDTGDIGVSFPDFTVPAQYSQVLDDHYYYLRTDGQGHYNIFCDQGEWVGMFVVEKKGYCVTGFVKYDDDFYALLEDGMVSWDEEYEAEPLLARIDLKKGKAVVVCDFGIVEPECEIHIQWYNKDDFYYSAVREVTTEEEDLAWEKKGKLKKAGKRFEDPEEVLCDTEFRKGGSWWSYVDGKVYYVAQEGEKELHLYSIDLKSGEKKEVLFCCLKENIVWEFTWFAVRIDKDYICFGNVVIPRNGGRIITFGKQGETDFFSIVHNSQYAFYIDKEHNIHRFCKDTQEDTIISDVKAQGIECTEKEIYVQAYDEYYHSDKYFQVRKNVPLFYRNHYSFDLYYMDLDGKRKKKFTKGSNGKFVIAEK